jgi:energy-coupling factor transporter ATP-binding protein EcfA2
VTRRGARVILDSMSFTYMATDSPALHEISLEVERGEIVWVTGPNASGKSTLFGVVAGVMPLVIAGEFGGSMTLERVDEPSGDVGQPTGAAVDSLKPSAAMVMQDSGVYLFRSVFDEIAFPLQNRGVTAGELGAEVRACLARLDIEQLEGRLMHTLSGGERQKVAVAAALAVDPDVLLLDEPFEQLDPASASEVIAAAHSAAHDGVTTFIATRYADNVPDGVKRVHLFDGRVSEPDPPAASPTISRGTRPAGDVVLEFRGVTHRYAAGGGISDIDLTVRSGESVAIFGPNGAGKTTLMKHAIGLLRPQSGSVRLEGVDTADFATWQLARTVGLLFQNPDDSIFNTTCGAEVAWSLTTRGMSKQDARAKAMIVMRELGIDSIAEENPHELPASQRQLVALASVLVTEPKLIVLDEPTKALDARASNILAAAIERRLDAGAAVLIVTHDPPFALRMTDRAVGIVDGRVIADGPSAQVFADRAVLQQARFVSVPVLVDVPS